MSADIRELVATASQVLGAAGHADLVWGHVSARDPDGRGAWLKHSGWGMEEVTAERVHLVGYDGAVIEGGGARHKEYPIHTETFRARPDVHAVVHTHSRAALALSASGQQLRPVSHEANFFVPPAVPHFTQTADLIRTPELGSAMAAALGDARAIFLVNHGIVCVGPDVPSAVVAAVLLDRACSQQILTIQAGPLPHWSDDREALEKRNNVYGSAVNQVWEYLVRRLRSNGR
ncbi:class II aldolase/adducin family protein [Streptomyces sp. NPDC051976]|uniref:class II aldolase/adducin family protein n=1 Tax=Streptomyces sp. NPDC051976 TaxID=3154947 RepID=UPI00342FF89F